MNKVRLAIQGSGIIARYHARACQAIPDVELVAAANWRPESLERFAHEWHIPRVTTTLADLAADREIDGVIVALPNYMHKDETVRLLRAGKHVLVEKPMAMNAAEAEEMVAVARETGCLLMVGHMWRFDDQVGWLRRVIDGGMLGEIVRTKGYAIHPPGTGPQGVVQRTGQGRRRRGDGHGDSRRGHGPVPDGRPSADACVRARQHPPLDDRGGRQYDLYGRLG